MTPRDEPPHDFINAVPNLREKIAAWIPVLRGYTSLCLGVSLVAAQLFFYVISDWHCLFGHVTGPCAAIFNPIMFGLSIALVAEPEKLVRAFVQQVVGYLRTRTLK